MDFTELLTHAIDNVVRSVADDIDKDNIALLVKTYSMSEDDAARFVNIDIRTEELSDSDFDFVYHIFLRDVEEMGYPTIVHLMKQGGWHDNVIRRLFRVAVHDGEFAL